MNCIVLAPDGFKEGIQGSYDASASPLHASAVVPISALSASASIGHLLPTTATPRAACPSITLSILASAATATVAVVSDHRENYVCPPRYKISVRAESRIETEDAK